MAEIQVKVLIPCVTGLPEDIATHDWSWTSNDTTVGTTDDILAALFAFYDTNFADQGYGETAGSLTGAMSDSVVDEDWTFKFYERNVVTNELTLLRQEAQSMTGLAADANVLPSECAVRMTAHGLLTGGESDRRKRGGWFFGPGLTAAACRSVSGGRVLVNDDVITRLRTAGRWLLDNQPADSAWVIYSGTGFVAHPVVGGWVDNAFDTIRSRGTAHTTRSSWTETP